MGISKNETYGIMYHFYASVMHSDLNKTTSKVFFLFFISYIKILYLTGLECSAR